MKNLILVLFAFFFFTSFLFSQTIQWEQLSGPHGGSIYSIVKDDNYGNIYVNTRWGAGPFKSTDNGESWFSIKNGLTPNNGEFHPMNINSNGDLFIGGAHSTAYLCRSTDQGNSWIPLPNLNTGGGSIICISFGQSNNIYVGTGTGIYKSTNDGENWTALPHFGPVQVDAIAFNDSGHIFAGTSYAVYRSTDDGASWTQLPTGGGTRTVAVDPNGYVFAGCWENGGILKSTDNGASWSYSYPQTVQIRSASTPFFDDYNYIYFPTHGKGVLFSSDYGNTWTEFNDGLGNKNVRAVTKTLNQFLFAGGDYGIFKCNSWAGYPYWYSTGLPVCAVKKIEIDQYDNLLTGVWGVNRSFNKGQTWETINNGLSNLEVKEVTIKNDGTIFLGCGINGPCIFRSTDNGNSWTAIENGIQRHDVEAIAIDTAGNIYAGNYYGVYKSIDNGDNWVNIGGAAGAKELCFNSIGDLFLASWGQGFWKLPAGDTTWINLTTNINSSWNWSMLIASNDYIYVGSKRSTDNGITWEEIPQPGPYPCYAENSVGHIFMGTRSYGTGIWRSIDFGESWEAINTGLSTLEIWSLAIDSEDYLYAGTDGKSMFKTTTSTVISVENENELPTAFYLEQNYPNPFNPSTTISWQSPFSGKQTIKLFDLLGREIETIVDGYYEAGNHSTLYIPNSTLSSGVYFYQLRAGSFVQTKKMILLR
uniref:T9SS type A sorting domain-containing protein n=1 Tax=Ignavibacterium album TaxID=591197 RepID=A0A832LKS0_9BACT